MKKIGALLAAACLTGSLSLTKSAVVFGQQTQPAQGQATQQGDKPDANYERKAYDALNAAIKEPDLHKKMAMAKEAMGLYPKSQYVPYMKQQIDVARGGLLQEALKTDNAADAFNIGGEMLAEDPENINILLTLADVSSRLAKKSDYTYADKGSQYAKKSIELINQGKKPAGLTDADWVQRKPLVLGSMHQTLGLFALKEKKDDEALNELKESAKQDCSDPVTHYLIAQVYNTQYEALGAQYRQLTDDQKTGDEGKALLDKINGVVDQLLEAYGKMMAVSDGKTSYDALRTRVKPIMEELFKFRHDGKDDGLQAFIDGFKTSCGAASTATPTTPAAEQKPEQQTEQKPEQKTGQK